MNAMPIEQSISDLYHDLAVMTGLKHVDGIGNRSIFQGDARAWGRLDAALALYPLSASIACARRRAQRAMG